MLQNLRCFPTSGLCRLATSTSTPRVWLSKAFTNMAAHFSETNIHIRFVHALNKGKRDS
jgi:hypothetical protein